MMRITRPLCLRRFYSTTTVTHTKNECKNIIVQRLSALELKNYIINRFGRRQLESKLLDSDEGKKLLYAISYFYSYSPEYAKGISIVDYALSNAQNLDLGETSPRIRWLWKRILQPASEDAVPAPHYPSILLNYMMQWPFQPSELDNYRDITSMYKFPFFKPTVDNLPEKSERFNPENHTKRVASLGNGSDNHSSSIDMVYHSIAKRISNLSSDSHIYSPSEMEVIQSDYLFNFDKDRRRR